MKTENSNQSCVPFHESDEAALSKVQRAQQAASEKKRKKEPYRDAIRGSLVGGAVGDALGYAVEFADELRIFSHFGEKGITQYRKDAVSGKALISDDTQMTLFTAVGILVCETRNQMRGLFNAPRGFVEHSYFDWLLTQNISYAQAQSLEKGLPHTTSWLLDVPELFNLRAPGNTCLFALVQRKANQESSTNYIDNKLNHSKGCGGVMRVAPVGLAYDTQDMEKLDKEAAQIAAITHSHPLGFLPAAVLAHIVNRCVYHRTGNTLKKIVIEANQTVAAIFADYPEAEELKNLLDLAIALSENHEADLDNIHRLGEGWVGEEALAIAVYCALRYEKDFSAAVIAAVNHKGDSDSTGAVTGNILGAWVGLEAIDTKWKQDLELYEVLLSVADDLCYGCLMEEFSAYHDRAWACKYMFMRAPDAVD